MSAAASDHVMTAYEYTSCTSKITLSDGIWPHENA